MVSTSCVTLSPAQSSGFATSPDVVPASTPVALLLASDPPLASEVGIIEAHGRRPQATLSALTAEFRARAASMGAGLARIDAFATRYDLVTEVYAYDCGTTEMRTETRSVSRPGPGGTITTSTESVTVPHHVFRSCIGTRTVEVAVLTLTGRAFRAKDTQ